MLGVVRAPKGTPGALGVGAAAAPAIERARWKALAEAFTARTAGVKLTLLDPGDATGRSCRSTTTSAGTQSIGTRRARRSSTPAPTAPARICPAARGQDTDEWLAGSAPRIEAAGSSAYAVDVTAPDVAELGLTVTRVVAPELCALDTAHAARFLGGRRLYEAAAALGLA